MPGESPVPHGHVVAESLLPLFTRLRSRWCQRYRQRRGLQFAPTSCDDHKPTGELARSEGGKDPLPQEDAGPSALSIASARPPRRKGLVQPARGKAHGNGFVEARRLTVDEPRLPHSATPVTVAPVFGVPPEALRVVDTVAWCGQLRLLEEGEKLLRLASQLRSQAGQPVPSGPGADHRCVGLVVGPAQRQWPQPAEIDAGRGPAAQEKDQAGQSDFAIPHHALGPDAPPWIRRCRQRTEVTNRAEMVLRRNERTVYQLAPIVVLVGQGRDRRLSPGRRKERRVRRRPSAAFDRQTDAPSPLTVAPAHGLTLSSPAVRVVLRVGVPPQAEL